jgi:NAD(P)-dependent dehydrogenase (short-subunit alcohol dehydrogenase family)
MVDLNPDALFGKGLSATDVSNALGLQNPFLSGLAVDGMPGAGIYGAARSALHGLTRSLSRELAPDGILTNVLMAGFTMTERVTRLPKTMLDQAAQSSPIRRLPMPEEVTATIVFVASAANITINGEIVRSSGGHS